MTDKEKKAIVELNHFSNMTAYWKQEEYTNSEIDNYIKIVLNLIEKQTKEIEELKDTRSIFNMGRRSYKNEIEDKIKAKIEELEKQDKESKLSHNYLVIPVLQSLLEKE